MIVNSVSSISFNGDKNNKRKVDQTDVAVLGGTGAVTSRATRGLVRKMTVTTKGVNEGTKYLNRVAEEVPKITSSAGAKSSTYLSKFYSWAGNSKVFTKIYKPLMNNPIVKKVAGVGTGALALAYTINEFGQLLTRGNDTFKTIDSFSKEFVHKNDAA